ncbi:MAG: hypothetical protein AB1453_03245 [Chloroflexota bacterium]
MKKMRKFSRFFFFFMLLILVWISKGCTQSQFEEALSIAEAWEARERINGKTVTLIGYFGKLEVAQTLQLCDPPRCDCNTTRASRIGLFDQGSIEAVAESEEYPKKMVILDMLQCKGDQCVIHCSPIDPSNTNELEVTGTFQIVNSDTPYPYLLLSVSEPIDIRQRINGNWQPVPTGTFEMPLAQP